MHSWLSADRVNSARRILALMAVFVMLAFVLPMAHAQTGSRDHVTSRNHHPGARVQRSRVARSGR